MQPTSHHEDGPILRDWALQTGWHLRWSLELNPTRGCGYACLECCKNLLGSWEPLKISSATGMVGIIFHMKGLGKQVAHISWENQNEDGEKYKCHNHIKHTGLKKHVSWHSSIVATWNMLFDELPHSNSMLGHPAVLTFSSDSSICVGLWLIHWVASPSECGRGEGHWRWRVHLHSRGSTRYYRCSFLSVLLTCVLKWLIMSNNCGQIEWSWWQLKQLGRNNLRWVNPHGGFYRFRETICSQSLMTALQDEV